MVLTITIILTILVIILAFRTNCLHKLEAVVLIVFISNLVNDIYSMGGLNLGLISTSNNMDEFFSFVVISAVLVPALITWMVGFFLSIRKHRWKYLLIVNIPFFLVALEYTADSVGIMEHHQMSMWMSWLVWCVVLLIVFLFRRIYFFLLKGV
ncbi:hypothetical protein [Ornithinibacillus sp. 179-J 7C1 HS]|uniref:hypothetical protein n=1 Tax=Ornithinibacillus sp. 179-J 7C1 HS TaxID=3142384 RepID=UPI0039A21A34